MSGSHASWVDFLRPLHQSECNGPSENVLAAVRDKLDVVLEFMRPEGGVTRHGSRDVGHMAIRFALDSLDRLGLVDGVTPQMPSTREGICFVLERIRTVVNGHLAIARLVASQDQDDTAVCRTEDPQAAPGSGESLRTPTAQPSKDEKSRVLAAFLKDHPAASIRVAARATGMSKTCVQKLPAWTQHMRTRTPLLQTSKRANATLSYDDNAYIHREQASPAEEAMEKEEAERYLVQQGFSSADLENAKCDVVFLKAQYDHSNDILSKCGWYPDKWRGLRGTDVIKAAELIEQQRADEAQQFRSTDTLR